MPMIRQLRTGPSKGEEGTLKCLVCCIDFGDMAKLVDALDLGSSEEIRVSSSLTIPTRNQLLNRPAFRGGHLV